MIADNHVGVEGAMALIEGLKFTPLLTALDIGREEIIDDPSAPTNIGTLNIQRIRLGMLQQ